MSAQASTLKNVADALLILEPMCAELCAGLEDREARLVPELDALNAAYESEIDDGLAEMAMHFGNILRAGPAV